MPSWDGLFIVTIPNRRMHVTFGIYCFLLRIEFGFLVSFGWVSRMVCGRRSRVLVFALSFNRNSEDDTGRFPLLNLRVHSYLGKCERFWQFYSILLNGIHILKHHSLPQEKNFYRMWHYCLSESLKLVDHLLALQFLRLWLWKYTISKFYKCTLKYEATWG